MVGYHVVLSEYKDLLASAEDGNGFVWVGKTADFQFKLDPEKTIDLDDGSQEVGSVKISWSFSIIDGNLYKGRRYLHLVPVEFMTGTMYTFDLKKSDAAVQVMENKTGEFKKTLVSGVARVPVEVLDGVVSTHPEIGSDVAIIILPKGVDEVVYSPFSDGEALHFYNDSAGERWGIAFAVPFASGDLLLNMHGGGDHEMSIAGPDGFWMIGEDKVLHKVG